MTGNILTLVPSLQEKPEHGVPEEPDDRSASAKSESQQQAVGDDGLEDGTLSRIATADYPKALKLTFIVVALILSIFLVALDMTIVATAIPRITDEFHSLNQVGWYGSAFFLTVASFQSTWGKAYKYFPLKPTFMLSIGIFEIGSLICGVAPNSTTLIVGRAIAGTSRLLYIGRRGANIEQEWVEQVSHLALIL